MALVRDAEGRRRRPGDPRRHRHATTRSGAQLSMGYTETRIGSLVPVEVFRVPRVTLIARPQFIEPEHLAVQWRGEASDGGRIPGDAGRLCYMSQHNPVHRTTPQYLENIKKQGHGSVLGHAGYRPLN